MLVLRRKLEVFYRRERTLAPDPRAVYSVGRLTLQMLGDLSAPKLKAKAAECRGMLPFAAELLGEHVSSMGDRGRFLLLAARSLIRIYQLLRENPRVMPHDVRTELMDQMLRMLHSYKEAGGHLVPKHHLMFHLIRNVSEHGNARAYHCFYDESLNGKIAKIASKLHPRTFAETVFRRLLFARDEL